MPITGLDRMPGSGLARGTLFDKELNVTEIDVPNLTIRSSLILNKSGEYQYNIIWNSPTGAERDLTIPSTGATDDTFTLLNLAQTMTNKTLHTGTVITAGTITGVTDIDLAVGNRTLFDTVGANTLTFGAGGTTVSIPGNLTVSGTTTTVNTTTLNVADNMFLMNSDFTGSATQDSGLVIERGDDTNVAIVWDESADQFIFTTTNNAGAGNDVTPIAYANVQLANLAVAQIGAFSLTGKLTAGSTEIEGSNFDIDGGDIASGTTINKSPVITLAGDLSGNATLSTLGNATLTATIVSNAVALTADTTGDYVATAQGTSNEIEVTGSGTEGRAITIGLPNDVTIAGDLTVSGTMTTVNTATMNVADKLIELATGTSGTPSGDSGIVIERGDSANAIMIWDESADKFVFGTTSATGSSSGDLTVTSGTVVAATFEGALTGNVTGNVSGTAPAGTLTGNTLASGVTASSLTSVGTLTALQVDNLNVNGNTITATSGAVNITPAGGSAIVLDGTINVDAGVVTGATSITSTAFAGTLTGAATTATNVIAAANAENENQFIAFLDNSNTTAQQVLYETSLVYNPSTTTLTVPNLNVSGTTTTVSTTDLAVEDEIITLAAEQTTGTNTDALDVGIASPYRVSGGTRYRGMFYDLSTTRWKFFNRTGNSDEAPGTSNIINTTSGFALGDLEVGNITGTLATAAQTNITTVGALDGGSITSNFGTIDTGSSNITTTGTIAGGDLTISGSSTTIGTVTSGVWNAGAVTSSGIITGTHLQLNDNAQVRLGTGSDATLYYNGTDTFLNLRAVGTGDLMIALAGSFPSPDPDMVHIWKGSAGSITADATSALTLEDSGDTRLTILTPSGSQGGLVVGDESSATVGQFLYNHSNNSWDSYSAGALSSRLSGGATPTLTFSGSAGTIANTSGDFTLNLAADLNINVDGGDITLQDDSVTFGALVNDSGGLRVNGGTTHSLTIDTSGHVALQSKNLSGVATLGAVTGTFSGAISGASLAVDNITIDGNEIDISSGDLTIDVAGSDVLLSAAYITPDDGYGMRWSSDVYIYGSSANAAEYVRMDLPAKSGAFYIDRVGQTGINTTAPVDTLHIGGGANDYAGDGQAFGHKRITLANSYGSGAQLTVAMGDNQSCYIKVFIHGNWTDYHSVTYLGEFFLQNTGNAAHNEPGAIIRQIDNTYNATMSAQIVDPTDDNFVIQFQTSASVSGTQYAYLTYHVMGFFDSIS